MSRRTAAVEFVVVWIALIAKAALMRWLVLHDPSPLGSVLYEGAMLAALLLLVDLLFPDHRFWALWTTDLLLSAAMLGTVLYASYYGQIATVGLLRLAGQVPAVRDSLQGLVSGIQVLFFVDLIVLLGARWFLVHRARRSAADEQAMIGSSAEEAALESHVEPDPIDAVAPDPAAPSDFTARPQAPVLRQHPALYVAALPLVVFAVITAIGISRLPQPVDGMAASRRGVLAYQVASLIPRGQSGSSNVDLHDPKAVQAEIERLRGGTTGKRLASFAPGTFKGKNLIVIQVESLQTAAIGLSVDGQEVTPNFNRLTREGFYFPNTFAQVGGGNTADAEFILNTSLYPPTNAAASEAWGDRDLPSLPKLLASQGYATVSFHANTVHFWNRLELYGAMGISKYYDADYFGKEDVMGMGASDEVLYRKTLPKLVELDKSGTPFFAQIITLTSHRPFDAVPPDRQKLKITGQYASTFPANYLVSQNYADYALGQFLAELDRTGLAKDSVVVVYGDHFGLVNDQPGAKDAEAQRALIGHDMTEADLLAVPLVVRLPDTKVPTRVDDAVGQADIMPTLADALGVDLSATPHFGRDAFVRSPVLMPAARIVPVGSFIDDRSIFVPGIGYDDGHAYSVVTKQQVPREDVQRTELDRARQLISLSERYADALVQRANFKHDDAASTPSQ